MYSFEPVTVFALAQFVAQSSSASRDMEGFRKYWPVIEAESVSGFVFGTGAAGLVAAAAAGVGC